MRAVEGSLVLSATDLTGFLECEHLAELERRVVQDGLLRPAERQDEEIELLRRLGDEHEAAYLRRLEDSGVRVVVVEREQGGLQGLRDFEARTLAAMRSGAEYIYQGGFFDGRWYGRTDFLRRVDTPSALGAWSYECEDAKLARSLKVGALVQLAEYSRQLERVQGVAPAQVHVILGTNRVESLPLSEVSAYAAAARQRLEATVDQGRRETYPVRVRHCEMCRWQESCIAQWQHDDHLTLVAGVHRSQLGKLEAAGVHTAAALAERTQPVPKLADASLQKLQRQALLQREGRSSERMLYELLGDGAEQHGLALLPEPSPGDLFFDMEGDSFAGPEGLEYLFGVLEQVDGALEYRAFWGHDPAAERRAFEGFIDFVMQRLRGDPALHVYHYAGYEPSALKRLAGRYGTREDDVDRLLRGKVLVDLYGVVRRSLQASTDSYSLKKLEPLYMDGRDEAITSGTSSIVAYERWMRHGDPQQLADIAAYNETDCRSTLLLRNWLESLRGEYQRRFGEQLPRPAAGGQEPSEETAAVSAETEALYRRLREGIPDDEAELDAEPRGRLLLANLLDWHRRESRPEWWDYFARRAKTEEELFDDPHAVAGLVPLGDPVVDGNDELQEYGFDPAQETRIEPGHAWHDPATGRDAGRVERLDRAAGRLRLRRAHRGEAAAHPRALIPPGPPDNKQQRRALRRFAEWVIEHGLDGPGRYRAVRDLLLESPPRVEGAAPGRPLRDADETSLQAALRIVPALDASVLPIQGPPGSGKTYTAAQIALALAAEGRRVGVTALSHKAISQLLQEICDGATRDGRDLGIVQLMKDGKGCDSPLVRCVKRNEAVVAALQDPSVKVVAGTSWLFCREEMDGALDTLIVDEASQMSLANVVAMAGAARNLVLCGDPQQLAQPTKGTHPGGAERSALEHVLGERSTIPEDRGLFLDVTRRMHPQLCSVISDVFYDGRLHADPGCASQDLRTPWPQLSGAGLRLMTLTHRDNSVRSEPEADAVGLLAGVLMQGSWTDRTGTARRLLPEDLVVVSPYNAQVAMISERLDARFRVGTVDRFQGQEAAVAIYSMATSSGEDQRRGMDFLYSLNRLNVALSRARVLAIVVCSPALAHVRCRTVTQLRLANALCRLMQLAEPLRAAELQVRPVQDLLPLGAAD